MNFGHVLTAMVTPFHPNGGINFKQTETLIEHLINNGTQGLVITGTTGESPTLTDEEKVSFYEFVIKIVNKRIPVIAGTGTYDTEESIMLTKEAEKCGVDGIMIVTPYYNKPNQQGLYNHFVQIAESTDLPIMIYNIPSRSVVDLTSETVIRLSEFTNIVAIKEASGDLAKSAEIIKHTKESFTLYSGEDHLALPIISIGGSGIVSVASHIIGKEMSEMIHAFKIGNITRASEIHRNILPLMKGVFIAPSPAPIKYALRQKGIDVGNVRSPLIDLNEKEASYIRLLLNEG